MEGRPRFDQEQPNEDDDSKESSKKKRKARSFSLGSFVERTKVGEGEDSERPEGRSLLARYERIRNRKDARPLIGEVQAVEDEKPKEDKEANNEQQSDQTNSVELPIETDRHDTVSEESVLSGEEESGETSSLEEEPDATTDSTPREDTSREWVPIVADTHEDDDPVDRPKSTKEGPVIDSVPTEETRPEATSDIEDIEHGPATDELEPTESDSPAEESIEGTPPAPVPEPESIEAILRRRAAEMDDSVEPEVEPLEDTRGVGETTVVNHNYTNNETYVYNENPNVGLHLLNYALARRRDTRDRKAANKQFKEVRTKIEDLADRQKELEREKELLEKHRNEQQKTAEMMTVFDRSKSIEKSNVDKKATIESAKNTKPIAETLQTKSVLDSPLRPEYSAAPAVESHVERYAPSPESRGIVSEKIFEQRHEIKDQGQAPTVSTVAYGAQNQGPAQQSFQPPVQQSYTNSHQVVDQSLTQQDRDNKTVNYREAAVTGAWGAIVGTIVFILLYVLTR